MACTAWHPDYTPTEVRTIDLLGQNLKVTHPSTILATPCLTSVVSQELMLNALIHMKKIGKNRQQGDLSSSNYIYMLYGVTYVPLFTGINIA